MEAKPPEEAMSPESGREARRKRILGREADRLALITGRISNLSPNSPYSSPRSLHSHTQSSPASFFEQQQFQSHLHQGNNNNNKVESELRKCGTTLKSKRNPFEEDEERDENQPLLSPEKVPKQSSIDANLHSSMNYFGSFTFKEINASIIESENTRVITSVAIAVLIVFSNINLPRHVVVRSRSTIASKPLYILMLIDVTIILIQLLEKQRRGHEEVEDKKKVSQEHENLDGALRILEMGLVLYQTVRGLFIDCSFYLVIVICGLSLI
ncbi:uncharacterized protein LOC124931860 [Impatiens glandulifera]|uniref:uncharacterized protein LOC124931860 n=1 Tax=Impatiens glandulifera TaxID=253017 RepID=UPI001FB086B7|nr:uncharacterized protein LOC124931860 [Impatiens glandulifera]